MKKIIAAWKNAGLILKIVIGIVIGAVLGIFFPKATPVACLGTLFVSALKAVAPILVFLLVMSSISKAGAGIGAMFKNVIILYLVSTLVSAVIAVLVHFARPLTEDIDAYFAREVLPYAPDAWIDKSKTKLGYEIPMTRYFYEYRQPEPSEEIATRLHELELDIQAGLADLFRED